MNRRILLVDDDIDVLSAFQRNLRKHFIISCASSGREGLELLRDSEPYSVIVSDFKMPKMSGTEFLSFARKISPNSVRIMLTGFADVGTAIEAVNEGNVFRFLTKPIPPDNLIKALSDGIEQYNLIIAEKEILEKTLKGGIKILIDVLSMINPEAFSNSKRYRGYARMVASELGIKKLWEIEIAALLSNIGIVSVPSEIVEKVRRGEKLDQNEEEIYLNHTTNGKNLLINIPRLEDIAVAIEYQNFEYSNPDQPTNKKSGDELPVISRILKVVIDFDNLKQANLSTLDAIQVMRNNSFRYDPKIFSVFEKSIFGNKTVRVIIPLKFRSLKIGMELADDIKDINGNNLVKRDTEVTDLILMRLVNASKVRVIAEPIRVYE